MRIRILEIDLQLASKGCPSSHPDETFVQYPASTKHAVRCCSDDVETCTTEPCADLVPYDEAVEICSNRDRRLCFLHELEKCCGTGCSFDKAVSWVQGNPISTSIDGIKLQS